MVAKKLLVDDKVQACVKQICLLGVVRNVSTRKTLSGKTFCFLKKLIYWYVNFVLWVTYCFFNEPLIGGDKFFKQGPAYKKGPDPNKGSKQQ